MTRRIYRLFDLFDSGLLMRNETGLMVLKRLLWVPCFNIRAEGGIMRLGDELTSERYATAKDQWRGAR